MKLVCDKATIRQFRRETRRSYWCRKYAAACCDSQRRWRGGRAVSGQPSEAVNRAGICMYQELPENSRRAVIKDFTKEKTQGSAHIWEGVI